MEFVEFIKTPMVNSVVLHRPFTPDMEGTLCVTGHHLILSSRCENHEELWLLHDNIDSVEKKLSGSGGTLTLKCKDFLILYLDIPSADDCINVAASIEALSNIDDITLRYPFFFRPMFEVLENGWQAFSPETEFNKFKECSEDWRISYVNKEFKVCTSYPQAVFVPKTVDDDTIIKAATFRQGGRFPVLSYYHRDSKAVLMRSSQPLTGPNGKRCKEDERLVNSVMGMGKRGYIVDTRAQSVAKMAQSKGGGYELEVHYPQWRRIHQPVERRQSFHDSLIKMIEACNDSNSSMDKWLSKLESSNWLTHVKDILTTACVVAQSMDKDGVSVLVHGSEGVDTTLLVSSLSQIILDHDCRTVTGFEALIEREWIQAGHPFRVRCNKSAYAITKQRQESPVFLLFIDCVWQIWQQFPCSFEFSEKFLITLFQHAYSSNFGTFLCNSEAERHKCKVTERTVSLWSFLNRPEVLQDFMNPMYEPNQAVIWPSVAPQSLTVWTGLYLRGVINQAPQEEAWQEIYKIREYDKELRSKVSKLRRQLASLEREAIANAVLTPPHADGIDRTSAESS
jgi:myotubularin-related protein 9